MAYESHGTIPKIPKSQIVPFSFPGLKKDADAQAPAVKSYKHKVDLRAVVSLVSGNAASSTVSTRLNRAIDLLSKSYNLVNSVSRFRANYIFL